MAKRNHINQIKSFDKIVFKALADVAILTKNDLRTFVSEKRFKTYVQGGYIKMLTVVANDGKTKDVYSLTPQGQRFAKKYMGLSNFYKSNSLRHDIKLSEKYMNLSDEQRASWVREKDLMEMAQKEIDRLKNSDDRDEKVKGDKLQENLNNKKISSVDGAYFVTIQETNQVVLHFLEVTTTNYGEVEIAAKEAFVTILGGTSFEEVKA